MRQSRRLLGFLLLWVPAFTATTALAQSANLRITEVDPDADQAEVTNTGAAFVNSAARPFCHRFNYSSTVPNGENFVAGQIKVFAITGLGDTDTDVWLYQNGSFANAAAIIHGVKYGPQTNVGRTSVATSAGIWPGTSSYAPGPPVGMTLAWDGFGFDPKDWYIDETPSMGSADPGTTPGTVASGTVFPAGTQDFETMLLGDEVVAITDWVVVNTSSAAGIFTVRAVNDVGGDTTPRAGSTRWLRIRDQDASAVENRFYSSTITSPDVRDYIWTFWINLEQTPPGGSNTRPRLTIQHDDGGFVNAWGIRLNPGGVALFVDTAGGTPAGTTLYSIGGNTDLGDWVEIELSVDFDASEVSATANGGTPVALPIDPAGTFDKTQFRFCYRGEGSGNVMTLLLDDVGVEVIDPLTPVFFNSLSADALERSVRLAWDVYADEPIGGFRVYRRRADGSTALAAVHAGLVDRTSREYTDRSVDFGATYQYVVAAVKPDGSEIRSTGATVTVGAPRLALMQNAPNPFKPSTTIEYVLPEAASVTLGVYDVRGQHVATLERGSRSPGTHAAHWDGRDAHGRRVSGGVYFYRLQAGRSVLTRKLVLLK